MLVEFKVVKLEKIIVEGWEGENPLLQASRAEVARGKAQGGEKPLSKVIDVEKSYNFRPYS